MALKDWKKRENTKMFQNNSLYRWINNEKRWLEIIIIKEFESYSVLIAGDANATKREYFKTKSEALKYAKEYMRKH